jgi:hypothetical protein
MKHIIARFLFSSLLAVAIGTVQAAVALTPEQARVIGEKIWHNEGLGRVENLTVWNRGEDFPSFGIGHFIWYPPGVSGPFQESFPQLLAHLKQTVTLPAWLEISDGAPWRNRDEFYAQIDSREMNELRRLLHDTIPQQVEFIVSRMEAALPKLLEAVPDPARRAHVERQYRRVAAAPNGPYALIDYVNFKGEGTSPDERYQGEGWGLLQVLEHMRDGHDAMPEFVRAADFVLTRRVRNADRDESRWLPGWRNRLQTYLN